MAARKPKVIVTRKLPDPVETRMRELFDTELNLGDEPLSRAQLAEAVSRADVLVPTITDRIDAGLLEKAGPQLKLIANFGAGIDHVDVAAANARGITVTNTPGVLVTMIPLALAAATSMWSTPAPKLATTFNFGPALPSRAWSILSVMVGTRTSARPTASASWARDMGSSVRLSSVSNSSRMRVSTGSGSLRVTMTFGLRAAMSDLRLEAVKGGAFPCAASPALP